MCDLQAGSMISVESCDECRFHVLTAGGFLRQTLSFREDIDADSVCNAILFLNFARRELRLLRRLNRPQMEREAD